MAKTSRNDYLPYECIRLPESILKMSKDELGESEETRMKCLRLLKNLIADCEHFKPRTDDEFLLKFLRGAKFNVPKAMEKLKKYYKPRKKYTDIFDQLYPSSTSELRERHRSHYILPYRNTDYSAIVVNRRGIYDNSSIILDEYFRVDFMCLECLTDNPVTQISGITVIFDVAGVNLSHLAVFTPMNIHKFIIAVSEAIPARYKALHVVNAPSVFILFYNLAYVLLPYKLKTRIKLHPNNDDWKSLHSSIPPEILPEEYGGQLGPMDYNFFQDMLLHKEEQFRENLKYGYQNH